MNSIMETVCSVCNKVRTNSKSGLNFQKLLTILRREFREQNFNLKIKTERDKALLPEEFYVNAYYDAEEDQHGEIPIEVVVHHNFDKDVIWSQKHVTDLLIQIFDAVVHEFKHQRQSIKRKYVVYSDYIKKPYKDYLEEDDEVDAYAISIAIELCRTLGKYRALRHIGKISMLARLKFNDKFVSPCLAAYFGQFENLQNPTLKRLSKKVYVRLQKIDTDSVFM
jgi:hypothetical protein